MRVVCCDGEGGADRRAQTHNTARQRKSQESRVPALKFYKFVTWRVGGVSLTVLTDTQEAADGIVGAWGCHSLTQFNTSGDRMSNNTL